MILLLSCFIFSVRLSIGLERGSSSGAIEVERNGKWYYVCDDGFTDAAAQVVCHSQKYLYGRTVPGSAFGKVSSITIAMSNVMCKGTENTLLSCTYKWGEPEQCSTGRYASVVCFNKTESSGWFFLPFFFLFFILSIFLSLILSSLCFVFLSLKSLLFLFNT